MFDIYGKKSKKRSAMSAAEKQELKAIRRDNIRWMTGFIFLAVGIFLICSLVSYLFYWRDDMSVMTQGVNPLYKQIYNNVWLDRSTPWPDACG